jgi:hypothetical protein
MATAPILTLTSIVPEHTISFDGTSYFIRPDAALTLRASLITSRAYARVSALLQKGDELSEADDQELSLLLQQTCACVLEAPPEVLAKLTDVQRFQVFMAFTPLRSKLIAPANGAAAAPSLTGANGSPDSSGSTAARTGAGSRTSRKR